jgi:hypothetical protein
MTTYEAAIAALQERALTAPLHEAAQLCERIRQLSECATGTHEPDTKNEAPATTAEPPTQKQLALIRRFRYTGPVRSKQHAAEIIDRLLAKKNGRTQ